MWLLAVAAEEFGQRRFVERATSSLAGTPRDVSKRMSSGPVGSEAERALVVGELVGRQAEVEQDPVGVVEAVLTGDRADVLEVRLTRTARSPNAPSRVRERVIADGSASSPSNRPSGWRPPGSGERALRHRASRRYGSCPDVV